MQRECLLALKVLSKLPGVWILVIAGHSVTFVRFSSVQFVSMRSEKPINYTLHPVSQKSSPTLPLKQFQCCQCYSVSSYPLPASLRFVSAMVSYVITSPVPASLRFVTATHRVGCSVARPSFPSSFKFRHCSCCRVTKFQTLVLS